MSTTTYMGLTQPAIGTDSQETAAEKVNTNNVTIDGHDHSAGKGKPIDSAGISIASDLPFNNNAATGLSETTYEQQSAAPATAQSIYTGTDGELHWIDNNGNDVTITTNGSVNAGSGSIGGLPSGTAAVNYNNGTTRYIFWKATNAAAALDAGDVIVRSQTGTSNNGITIRSPITGATAGYTMQLPSAPPAVGPNMVSMNSSGTLAIAGITAAAISNLTVDSVGTISTGRKVLVGQQVSSSCGTFSWNTNGVLQAVTNLSVTLVSTGRPVMIGLIPDGSGVAQILVNKNANSTLAQVSICDGATEITQSFIGCGGTPADSTLFTRVPVSSIQTLYVASGGSHTYTVKVYVENDNQIVIANAKLYAYEL